MLRGDRSKQTIALIFFGWFCLALTAGGAGWLRPAPAPVIALIVIALTVLSLFVSARVEAVRSWIEVVDLRVLVSLHLCRFVGIYFLLLARRGELNPEFALPAGLGDCMIAIGALVLLTCWGWGRRKLFLLAWNVIGLLDIVLVVVLALRVGLRDWISMAPLRELPLALLPGFLVPLIIVSHLAIFRRLAAARRGR